MHTLETLNAELNSMLNEGRFMEAFERFYDESVEMQENETAPRHGKTLNREACGAFVANTSDLALTVKSEAVAGQTSFQEVLFEFLDPQGQAVTYTEVAVRKWNKGMVIAEKFYYSN